MSDIADAVTRHGAQLDHYGIPLHLREIALHKAIHEEFGAPWAKSDGRVVAAEDLAPENDVFVLEHAWLFQTAKDAADKLKESDDLREKMKEITSHFSKEVATSEGAALIEQIVVNLVHCAYSIKFGHTASDLYHYVIDNLGSMLRCSNTPDAVNVQVVPLFCMDTGKLVSLMWATKAIAKGDVLVRPHATKISLIQLGKQAYWETRYEGEDEFDWYCAYKDMKDLVKRHVKLSDAILLAGTGASTLPIDMENAGFTHLVAMDYAANVMEKLRNKYPDSSVQFLQADMTCMSEFADDQFDCILDKGCLDTMLLAPETEIASSNVWRTVTDSNADEFPEAFSSMKECMRILKPDGIFFLISFGSPNNRVGLLDWPTPPEFMWEILECLEMSPQSDNGIAKPFFIYVLQKQRKPVN